MRSRQGALRITGGTARGRVLAPVRDGIRPTSGRVREAWFSMMGQDLSGLRFLDAFAGSGLMGLEAWSRGATVVACERDRASAEDLFARATALGAPLDVRHGDVLAVAPRLEAFDLVYVDPPYALDPVPVLEALGPVARRLTLESASTTPVPAQIGGLRRVRSATYGGTVLHLFDAVP